MQPGTLSPTNSNYTFTFVNGSVAITPATPTVTWNNPASIPFGTTLSATQLNATASVGGTFAYTPAAGTTPATGTDTLSVTFTPTDTTDYTSVTKTVQITVTQAAPVITWNNPASIPFGTTLSATQLNATASVGGTFAYTPAAGTTPATGTDTLVGDLHPDRHHRLHQCHQDGADHRHPGGPGDHLEQPGQHPLRDHAVGDAVERDGFGGRHLRLYAGSGHDSGDRAPHTLSVTFTPTDTTDYTSVTKTVQITVTQAAPTITWNNPASIAYGTALSATQFNATASVGGTFAYTPAAGTTPATGTDTLSVTFTPTDTTDYTSVTKTVQITVTPGARSITWNNPANIPFGTALSATQLNATASVARHVRLYAGGGHDSGDRHRHPLGDLHPDRHHRLHQCHQDGTDHRHPGRSGDHLEQPGEHPLRDHAVGNAVERDGLGGRHVRVLAGSGHDSGDRHRYLSVTFTPTDTTDYTSVTKTVQITVTQAAPVITWNNPANIPYRDHAVGNAVERDGFGGRHVRVLAGSGHDSGDRHRHALGDLHPDRHHRLHQCHQDGADHRHPGCSGDHLE